ncbi:DUF1549 domain-containing protein [Lentisphaera profundi]|uniref:DUF1549 domain-containing protein n=1 Tax=Lentisphaera profundi TaxID=1658616 RepID=A0ABY7VNM8_9BACT|nr:DUF1549 domain-containing protein [Lentisphaera profundi]WDE95371.1 DUF1549 domain-containing protein [Lentisphaera profundi]
MKLFCTLVLLTTLCLKAEVESSDRLVRRLYLDTQNRLPELGEYYSAKDMIGKGQYERLVDKLLKTDEFRSNLATKIVDHYAPKRKEREQHPLVYRSLEKHIKETYVKPDLDFRQFIRDMLSADGISARNQMVLFFTGKEDSKMMAGRFTENIWGITLACAECHDHKYYPELTHKNFWSMATFFEGMDKRYVKTDKELKDLKKRVGKSYKAQQALGDEYKDVLDWISMEEKGENIYDEISYEDSRGQKLSMEFKMDEMSQEKSLVAPQLYIFEKERRLTHLKLEYIVEEKKYTARPRLLFGQNRPLHITKSPRDYLAEWMAYKKPKYFSRSTSNWVSHWLIGRGIVMPANDVYGASHENAKRLDIFAKKFEDNKFDLYVLVRRFLLSDIYKLPSSEKSDEEGFIYFTSRKIRHLSGEQILNILMNDEFKKFTKNENWQSLYSLEKNKEKYIDQLFPSSLSDSEAFYRGSLSQALFLASNSDALDFIDGKANFWYEQAKKKDFNLFINEFFITYYTRLPTERERLFFKNKVDAKVNYPESGFFEMTWAIFNSPEIRVY